MERKLKIEQAGRLILYWLTKAEFNNEKGYGNSAAENLQRASYILNKVRENYKIGWDYIFIKIKLEEERELRIKN